MNLRFVTKDKKKLINTCCWVLLILFIFFFFRIPALNDEVAGDEFFYYFYSHSSLVEDSPLYEYSYVYFIPMVFYKLGFFLTHDIVGVRMISLFFGLFNLILAMVFVNHFFDRRASLIFGLLYSLVPWTVFSSVLLDNDATIISSLIIGLLWISSSMIKAVMEKNRRKITKRSFFFAGVIIGLLLFLKLATTLISCMVIIFVLAYLLVKWKSYGRKILFNRTLFVLLGLAASIFSLCVVEMLIFGGDVLLKIRDHYLTQTSGGLSGLGPSFFMQLMIPIIFFSPFIVLSVISCVESIFSKDKIPMLLSLVVISTTAELFFLTYLHNALTLNRYLTIVLAPALILTALYISRHNVLENMRMTAVFSLLALFILSGLHSLAKTTLNFYPKSFWTHNILSFSWNFLFPITASNGPLGFFVSFIAIILPLILVGLLSLSLLFKNGVIKKAIKPLVLASIVIISLAYCLYVDLQFSYSLQGPSIESVHRQLRIAAENDTSYYVFRNNAGFFVQNEGKNYSTVKPLSFEDENSADKVDEVILSGEYVYILDFPRINKESLLWTSFNEKCLLQSSYKSKGQVLGYIFDC